MTDSGDRQIFNSADSAWSGKAGFAPTILPNGVVTGKNMVIPAVSTTNDLVDVKAFSANSIGVVQTVSAATDETITRGATSNIGKISSVTMDSAGAIAILPGTDSSDATVNDVRASAGGPPLIPVDSVELAQVRLSGTGAGDAAAITAAQIFQVPNQHTELANFPTFDVNNIGKGTETPVAAEVNAFVKMASVLPASHTGAVAKRIYIQYYTPTFTPLSRTVDFVPVEISHSSSSQELYLVTVGSSSSSLGQGSFTALLTDGITDDIVVNKNQVITVKFFSDINKAPFILTQGLIGVGRTFPVEDQNQAAITITSEVESADFSG